MTQTEINKDLPRDGAGLPPNATPGQKIEHHSFVLSVLRSSRNKFQSVTQKTASERVKS